MPQRNTTPPPPQSTPPLTLGPRSTPSYLLMRTARSLQLCFVVQGMQGEAMDFPAETLDMAFLLKTDAEEERLERRDSAEKRIRLLRSAHGQSLNSWS
jgi:hypothetical protein